jgi:hypothetical protein
MVGWERRMRSTLTDRKALSELENSRIEIQVHSNSRFCVNIFTVEITNKMRPCIRIYYCTIHWRLNMFRAAYLSSLGALTVFAASGLHTNVVTGRSQVSSQMRLDYGRSLHAYVNERLRIQLELLMMRGMPLETCWAFNEWWNNKF